MAAGLAAIGHIAGLAVARLSTTDKTDGSEEVAGVAQLVSANANKAIGPSNRIKFHSDRYCERYHELMAASLAEIKRHCHVSSMKRACL
jgi:hypothetical protein